ncbi:MAG: (2Fe-2S)-binding protein [Burkholderiales bacterium]|nr:(2Fe-2S)-binding protein [Burkholderiales bacterium]
MAVRLDVNGAVHKVPAELAEPEVSLVHVLRDGCGLVGTRLGCGANQCGACHVLIDGASVPSCDTPLWAAEGKTVVTVEGLAHDARGAALQQAFIDLQAGQCGYCLSGILVSATALLAREADPSDAAVRAALDRHLCRCGAHNRIVRAVRLAAQRLREGIAA